MIEITAEEGRALRLLLRLEIYDECADDGDGMTDMWQSSELEAALTTLRGLVAKLDTPPPGKEAPR